MPQALTTQLVDRLYAIGSVRRFLWKRWYSLLTQRLKNEDVVFLNYAYEEEPPMRVPLSPAEEVHRGSIQLYHRVALLGTLAGKAVLEVSCGHGGGAAYLARTFGPRTYIGLDLNARGVRFCQERHTQRGLGFVQGDAENLPFPDGHFDVVLNIEASHCYGSFPAFLAEAERVLAPGGLLLYADFRFAADLDGWERQLQASPLVVDTCIDISPCVLRGMEANSARSSSLVRRHLPSFLHKAGDGFAGVKGSGIYNSLRERQLSYRAYRLCKPASRTPASSV